MPLSVRSASSVGAERGVGSSSHGLDLVVLRDADRGTGSRRYVRGRNAAAGDGDRRLGVDGGRVECDAACRSSRTGSTCSWTSGSVARSRASVAHSRDEPCRPCSTSSLRSGRDLGETVLIEAGYNDPAAEFPQRVEDAVEALLAAGVKRILWVDMREWQQQYIGMNQTLVAAAARHPQLTIIDWEGVIPRPLLVVPGRRDPPRLRRRRRDGDPPERLDQGGALRRCRSRPQALASRARGQAVLARLAPRAGDAPYSWRVTSGPLPRGLHLLADGRITGEPRRPGRLAIVLQAADSRRRACSARLCETLTVVGGRRDG